MKNNKIIDFTDELSSSKPVPGGGGASALMGALSASLCSMVCELTSGKRKYAMYQEDIERIMAEAKVLSNQMLDLMQQDADVFEPLSRAYSIPKEEPGRDDILEEALRTASKAPYEMVVKAGEVSKLIEELVMKGSRLAISDVGVAATACKAALEGASMNVYINTKLMKDREYAQELNERTAKLVDEAYMICDAAYENVRASLLGE